MAQSPLSRTLFTSLSFIMIRKQLSSVLCGITLPITTGLIMRYNRKIFRIWASALLMERVDRLRFFTLTVAENSLPLREVADRWRAFANTRWWRSLKKGRDYIITYEPHPNGHGWHIHCLTNFYIPWQELQLMARSVHFGHTDIEAVDSSCSLYVAKYVSKSEVYRKLQDSRHVRIVNVSRRLLALKDVAVSSPSIDFIRSNWGLIHGVSPLQEMRELYRLWLYEWSGLVLSPFVEDYLCRKFDSQYKQGVVGRTASF